MQLHINNEIDTSVTNKNTGLFYEHSLIISKTSWERCLINQSIKKKTYLGFEWGSNQWKSVMSTLIELKSWAAKEIPRIVNWTKMM